MTRHNIASSKVSPVDVLSQACKLAVGIVSCARFAGQKARLRRLIPCSTVQLATQTSAIAAPRIEQERRT